MNAFYLAIILHSSEHKDNNLTGFQETRTPS